MGATSAPTLWPHAMRLTSWNQWQQALRERGWGGTVLHALHRLLQRVHAGSGLVCYRFLAQPLRPLARLPAGRGQAHAFRLLRQAEPVLATLGRPPAVIARRFAEGAHCLLATRGQALAGCIWFVPQRYREDEVRVDYLLPPHCVWDFDVYVAPSERLGPLFARQWDVLDAVLLPAGVRHSLSRVQLANRHSLRSHRSLGASDCGWALFVRLGSAQLMVSSLWPYVALGGRPCLRMPVPVAVPEPLPVPARPSGGRNA